MNIKITSTWQGNAALVNELPDTPLIRHAYSLAVTAHTGQMRRSGEAYVNHVLRVALRLLNFGEEAICAGLLHDTLEDSPLTASDLRAHGFSEAVISAVLSVSKQEGESYDDLVKRACADRIGRLVKLADNRDNSSAVQLAPFTAEKQDKQRAKYMPARLALNSVIPVHERVLIAA